jgi:hypothetical protein
MPAEEPYHHADHNVTPRNYSHSRNKQNANRTTTDIVKLRSRVAAGLRHKPSRNIKVTVCTGQ